MPEAFIVSSVRTPVGRAAKGALRTCRPDDLAAIAIREAIARVPGLSPAEIDDVILGCAMPEAEQGMNLARIASLRAGLPVEVPAMTINRFCASGLQAIALAAERILSGAAEVIVAGGAESMSLVPMGGHKVSPNPWLLDHYPDAYISMGLGAEHLARKLGVTRQRADESALQSHRKALAAIAAGKFEDEIVPVETSITALPDGDDLSSNASHLSANGGWKSGPSEHPPRSVMQRFTIRGDDGPRADTSLEALASLKPAFHAQGTITAGNSSQMSDGAAAAVVMSAERAKAMGVKPRARLASFAVAGCPPEEFGIGPVYAIPKALKMAGLALDAVAVIELNEAFAAQALAVIQQAGLDPARVNPNGGAVALGHPLGCTGAKLVACILRELARRDARYGLVTMCVGGGMGAAGLLERL
jgi:acetyl-CoA acyltransferase